MLTLFIAQDLNYLRLTG